MKPLQKGMWRRRREPRSPDKVASQRRRRSIAGAGWLPPALASYFSTGLQAVLSVIAREYLANGSCSLCNDRIAAHAGVCATTVKNAVREAIRLGLLVRQVRPRLGQKHDTSILMIVSSEWLTWLRYHPMSEGGGGKKVPTTKQDIYLRESLPQRRGIFRHFEPSGETPGQRERERGRLRA
jgi:hypothetical protein